MLGLKPRPSGSYPSLPGLRSRRERTGRPRSRLGCALCPTAERKEILLGTKGIAVKAARRRSRALATEGCHLLAPAMQRSSLSLHSLSEADDSRPLGLLACKRPPSPTLQHAASEDNLSSSTGEAPSQVVGLRGNGPGPWLCGQKKSLGKKREESLEAKRRKRRSRSFEVTGQGVRPGVRCLGPFLVGGA